MPPMHTSFLMSLKIKHPKNGTVVTRYYLLLNSFGFGPLRRLRLIPLI